VSGELTGGVELDPELFAEQLTQHSGIPAFAFDKLPSLRELRESAICSALRKSDDWPRCRVGCNRKGRMLYPLVRHEP
jgi:hypothetical protein